MFNELIAFDRESARTFDKNGYMHVAACRLSKACVSPYRGREIDRWQDLGLQPDQIYQVYRPAEELAKAALSFHGMPLMDNHVPVSSSELEKTKIHQRLVGSIEGNVRMVGDYLVGDVVVWTDGAQDGIETKAQSDLSCGYRYDLDLKPGRAPNGQPYDMSMHTISANHVALVPDGRVPGAMIADAAPRISVAGALRECFEHQEAESNPGALLASDALRECFQGSYGEHRSLSRGTK